MGLEQKAISKRATDEIRPNKPKLDEKRIKMAVTRNTFIRD